jgi:hypothetical protein
MKLLDFFTPKQKEPEFRKKHDKYDRGMDTESQGGVWITANPNKFTVSNTHDEVDFDKLKGIK